MTVTPAPVATPVPPAPPVRNRAYLGSRRRRWVAGVVIAGVVGFLLFQGLTNSTQYFYTADQAVAHRSSLGAKAFRIEGTVENDVRQVSGHTEFDIYANGTTVPVVDSKNPPQLFKPGIPVVLEGHWSWPVFASDLIMVKHSASYTEAHPGRLKSQLPTSPTTTP
jgi:cytochrome c-type biogenesis protein CcmE